MTTSGSDLANVDGDGAAVAKSEGFDGGVGLVTDADGDCGGVVGGGCCVVSAMKFAAARWSVGVAAAGCGSCDAANGDAATDGAATGADGGSGAGGASVSAPGTPDVGGSDAGTGVATF